MRNRTFPATSPIPQRPLSVPYPGVPRHSRVSPCTGPRRPPPSIWPPERSDVSLADLILFSSATPNERLTLQEGLSYVQFAYVELCSI